jgi:CIC family chloride channel protein
MTGLFYHDGLSALFPHLVPAEQGYYGLLGMAGVVSSVLQAPLTGIFLVMEITGGHDVLVSVVLVSVLSATLSGFFEPDSLYHRNLLKRGQLLRARSDARVLAEMRVVELLETDCIVVPGDMKLGELVQVVSQSRRNYFAVEDAETNQFAGLATLDNVRSFILDQHLYESMLVEDFVDERIPEVKPSDNLTDVMASMDDSGSFSLPVVENGHFMGLISKATLLDHYRQELIAQEES